MYLQVSQTSIVSVRLGVFFSFFCWLPVEVEQWWRSNGGGERERERERVKLQMFLGLEIGLECNK